MRLCLLLTSLLSIGRRSKATSPMEVDDLGRCEVVRLARESDTCYAVRCAEDFVARNGYTQKEAVGRIRLESVERGQLADILRARRRTLASVASAYLGDSIQSGHAIAFRYTESRSNDGRVVTMTGDFDNLKVAHQDLVWPTESRLPDCESR